MKPGVVLRVRSFWGGGRLNGRIKSLLLFTLRSVGFPLLPAGFIPYPPAVTAYSSSTVMLTPPQWAFGNGLFSQWHFLSDSKSGPNSLMLAVGAYSRQIRDAILVFDMGYWHPDPALWDSVKGVSWGCFNYIWLRSAPPFLTFLPSIRVWICARLVLV